MRECSRARTGAAAHDRWPGGSARRRSRRARPGAWRARPRARRSRPGWGGARAAQLVRRGRPRPPARARARTRAPTRPQPTHAVTRYAEQRGPSTPRQPPDAPQPRPASVQRRTGRHGRRLRTATARCAALVDERERAVGARLHPPARAVQPDAASGPGRSRGSPQRGEAGRARATSARDGVVALLGGAERPRRTGGATRGPVPHGVTRAPTTSGPARDLSAVRLGEQPLPEGLRTPAPARQAAAPLALPSPSLRRSVVVSAKYVTEHRCRRRTPRRVFRLGR